MTSLIVREPTFVDGLAAGLAAPFPADRLIGAAVAVVDVPPTLDGLYADPRGAGAPAPARAPRRRSPPRAVRPGPRRAGVFYARRLGPRRQAALPAGLQNPAAEYWVLGQTADDLPADLRDPDAVYDGLMARYQSDYVAS